MRRLIVEFRVSYLYYPLYKWYLETIQRIYRDLFSSHILSGTHEITKATVCKNISFCYDILMRFIGSMTFILFSNGYLQADIDFNLICKRVQIGQMAYLVCIALWHLVCSFAQADRFDYSDEATFTHTGLYLITNTGIKLRVFQKCGCDFNLIMNGFKYISQCVSISHINYMPLLNSLEIPDNKQYESLFVNSYI